MENVLQKINKIEETAWPWKDKVLFSSKFKELKN